MLAAKSSVTTLVAYLLLFSCTCGHAEHNQTKKMESADDTTTVTFAAIGQGGAGWKPSEEFFGPQFLLFRSAEQWDQVKTQFPILPHTTDPGRLSLLEQVDFARQSILVFTFGLVGSTGYALELERFQIDRAAHCYLKSTRPAPDETVGAAMGHPFHLVIVDRTDFPEQFIFYVDGELTEFDIHRVE